MSKAERQQKRLSTGWEAVERGDFLLAETVARTALQKNPRDMEFLRLLGTGLSLAGRPHEAIAPLREAFEKGARQRGTGYHLGSCYLAVGESGNASKVLEREARLFPDWAELHNQLGVSLIQQARNQEALPCFEKAIELSPGLIEAYINIGYALNELRRHEEAVQYLKKAIEAAPRYAEAHDILGNALMDLRRYEEALASYGKAIALRPGSAEMLYNRANVLGLLDRYEEAITSFEAALTVKSDYVDALVGKGDAEFLLRRYEEAIASYDRVLLVDPDRKYIFGSAAMARRLICDWTDYGQTAQRLSRDVKAGKLSATPLAFIAFSDSPAEQHGYAATYIRDQFPQALPPMYAAGAPYHHDKIRLAYLSADFREHAVANCVAQLFELHDRSRFEVIGVSFGRDDASDMRARLIQGFDRFIDVRGRSDAEIAELLRNLEADIAIDLMGYTRDARPGIFARRAAPIQVTYLGYPGTSGSGFIDYLLADKFVLPEEHQEFYSEKIAYLPDSYQVNDAKRQIAAHTPTRAEAGLPHEGFVFCCFNFGYKITPRVFDVWIRLLAQVPESVLWLLQDHPAAARNLRRQAQARGVDPDRLFFAPRIKIADYRARFRLADLFLDTLPYNAHGTASDALWAGLPVLSCVGNTFAGRVGGSLLRAVGLPELVTTNLEEYEALGLRLATDSGYLAGLRSRLERDRLSTPLFDTDRFRRHVESAYTTMWEVWRRGEPPQSFSVPPIV